MKVISFNSYKGGACRTTTCYNTIPYLAKILGATEKRPLLIVDFDLDSMGMTKLISDDDRFNNTYSANSLLDARNSKNRDIVDEGLDDEAGKRYFSAWEKAGKIFGLEEGSVLFLGADADVKTISDAVFEALRTSSPIEWLIKELRDLDEDVRPVAMIFDCAAGMQKTTQMALSYSDISVVCMRPTSQFRDGTAYYLKNSYRKIFESRNVQARRVIVVPTSVAPITAGKGSPAYQIIRNLRSDAFTEIEDTVSFIYRRLSDYFTVDASMIDSEDESNMGIPEVERLKWCEETPLIAIKDPTEGEIEALERYKKLAEVIAR